MTGLKIVLPNQNLNYKAEKCLVVLSSLDIRGLKVKSFKIFFFYYFIYLSIFKGTKVGDSVAQWKSIGLEIGISPV